MSFFSNLIFNSLFHGVSAWKKSQIKAHNLNFVNCQKKSKYMHFSLKYAVLKKAVINRIFGDYPLMTLASEVAFCTFIVAGGWAFGPITIQAMDDLGRLQGK